MIVFALALGAFAQTGPAALGLPATPKELATACSGHLLAELGRQSSNRALTDLSQSMLLDTSGKWMALITAMTGQSEDELMEGDVMAATIDAATGANLDLKPAQIRFCAANAPTRR